MIMISNLTRVLLGVTLLSGGVPGHLLHHVLALLPGGGETLPGAGAGALLIINILGEGGKLVLPELIRKVITNLAWRVDIRTLLLGSGTATPGVSSMFGHWRWSWSS